ncbi:methyl-accepting chemotaxis protein [Shewanella sp. OMA3-2]|uniref:methyl-accepting chemotaxis protein n=1 Tax=Shewanella sp. OMA3-2 TaxID=2908650 RepID=UPI001F2C264C|nr:methyl-accepting chemotaxis protein [Shewanella sp. OMA3-2]UJF22546.1 methyl-accepting chemotaxis protein [Shewanella sp. OMA3-2]
MNFQSIRVKSSIPMVLLGATVILIIVIFSFLLKLQSVALEVQSQQFMKAISLVLNADRDLYQAELAETRIIAKLGDFDTEQQDRLENARQVKTRFDEYIQLLNQYPDVTSQFSEFDNVFEGWLTASNQFVDAASQGHNELAQYEQDALQKFKQLRVVLDKAGVTAENKADELKIELDNNISTLAVIAFVIVFAALIIAGWFSYLVPKALTSQMRLLTRQIAEIADGDGDLTTRIDIHNQDEFGDLAVQFNRFVANLRELITTILAQSSDLKALTIVLSDSAVKSKSITQTLNVASDSIVSAVHEMSASSKEMAEIASTSADEAVNASNMATTGITVVANSNASINELSNQMDQALSSSLELQKSSASIASVLDVIRGIAEQTNLLALNAAIEAARAGEQGRGFAVVADEVRTLATRTQESTNHIQTMIQQLQLSVNQSADAISSGKQLADKTIDIFEEANQVFKNLQQSSTRVNEMSTQTALATEEQTAVSDEISQNLFALNEQTSSARSVAQTSEQLAREISALSNTLSHLVERFKV